MFTNKDINGIITNFKTSLIQQGIPVEHLWLFCSYAKGFPHRYSDIDVAVFSSAFTENPFDNIKYLQQTQRIPQMQIHLFTLDDLKNNPFVQEIANHAVEY
jgi:predicted nucleotidyltransferase